MVEPNNMVEVSVISTGIVKAKSVDFCHFITEPILPVNMRFAGKVPEQIVCADETVPPTVDGVIVIKTGVV